MTATPTWFGPQGHPLMGWVHTPADGRTRGGVVICPPFGKEYLSAYSTLRVLGERLAAAGLTALRFDYAGTGDSAGGGDPDQVEGWLSSIVEAAAFLRRIGCAEISLVGMRIGAVLAATAAERLLPLTALVLWDPCGSGKTYLREQRMLQRVALGAAASADDGSVEVPGGVFDAQTAADLAGIHLARFAPALLPPDPDRGERILALPRPEHRNDRVIRALDDAAEVRVVEAVGQAELLDIRSFSVKVRTETIDVICDHVAQHATTETPVDFTPQDEAAVGVGPAGGAIVERFARLGPDRLFAIITEPAAADRPAGPGAPTAVCLNVATEHHIGPARMWVEVTRRCAAAGITGVRFDRRGVGDSIGADGRIELRSYTPGSVADTVAAVGALRADGAGPIALVGLCSGAWAAAVAARSIQPRAVCLVNLSIWKTRPAPLDGPQLDALNAANRADAAVESRSWRARVKELLPHPLWLLLGALGHINVPEILLAPLSRRGVAISLAFAGPEHAKFVAQRGARAVRRLRRRSTVRCIEVAGADHAMLLRPGREQLLSDIPRWLAADLTGHAGRDEKRASTPAARP